MIMQQKPASKNLVFKICQNLAEATVKDLSPHDLVEQLVTEK